MSSLISDRKAINCSVDSSYNGLFEYKGHP